MVTLTTLAPDEALAASPPQPAQAGQATTPQPLTYDAVNQVINYTLVATNDGNVTLTGVTVTDPNADAYLTRGADLVGDNDALLEVGETWAYTAGHTLTQAEIDSNGGGNGWLENTATAHSNETPDDSDDASVPVERTPALNITKEASVPGGTANWTFADTTGNYNDDSGSVSIDIYAADLTITANDQSKDAGQALTLSGAAFTASGLKAGETVGSVTLTSAGAAGARRGPRRTCAISAPWSGRWIAAGWSLAAQASSGPR